eukprot:5479680-Prymnesium_polylepis.1
MGEAERSLMQRFCLRFCLTRARACGAAARCARRWSSCGSSSRRRTTSRSGSRRLSVRWSPRRCSRRWCDARTPPRVADREECTTFDRGEGGVWGCGWGVAGRVRGEGAADERRTWVDEESHTGAGAIE